MTTITGFGSGPEHGQSVLASAPQFGGYSSDDFAPKYVCASYMRFAGVNVGGKLGSTLIERHAYFPATTIVEAEKAAKKLLEAIGTNDYSKITPIRYSDNFWRFGFNSQQVIVLFVDNDQAIAGFDPGANEGQIVRFCAYSGQDQNKPRRMNYAFCGLEKIDFTTIDTTPWTRECKIGYRLNFWNTDDNGQTITGTVADKPLTHYLYAMNIHLRILATALAQPPLIPGPEVDPPAPPAYIPMIVDPDTGNMGGSP